MKSATLVFTPPVMEFALFWLVIVRRRDPPITLASPVSRRTVEPLPIVIGYAVAEALLKSSRVDCGALGCSAELTELAELGPTMMWRAGRGSGRREWDEERRCRSRV